MNEESDKTKSSKPQKRWWDLAGWGFSQYERRAVYFLLMLILVGSGVRLYRNTVLYEQLKIVADSSACRSDTLKTINNPPAIALKIDINKASVEDLVKLPGIGPVKARSIYEYRIKNDGFQTIKELTNVHGIGDKTLDRIDEFIFVKSDAIKELDSLK